MTTSQQPVVLTNGSIEAGDEEVVDANVHVVDAMHGNCSDDRRNRPPWRSAATTWTSTSRSPWRAASRSTSSPPSTGTKRTPLIREGMASMGATAHLELFNRTVEALR